MEIQFIITAVYLAGFALSRWMLTVEHEAEDIEFTNGDIATRTVLSLLLSWLMVIFLLIKAWVVSVKPYWGKTPGKTSKPKEDSE